MFRHLGVLKVASYNTKFDVTYNRSDVLCDLLGQRLGASPQGFESPVLDHAGSRGVDLACHAGRLRRTLRPLGVVGGTCATAPASRSALCWPT